MLLNFLQDTLIWHISESEILQFWSSFAFCFILVSRYTTNPSHCCHFTIFLKVFHGIELLLSLAIKKLSDCFRLKLVGPIDKIIRFGWTYVAILLSVTWVQYPICLSWTLECFNKEQNKICLSVPFYYIDSFNGDHIIHYNS